VEHDISGGEEAVRAVWGVRISERRPLVVRALVRVEHTLSSLCLER